jgi:glycine/D-amino acid oxidase-like deaminating enzyme
MKVEIGSLWAATAKPAPETPPLTESRRADVAIVGGGYTGLSAALHLAAGGTEVVLLEAGEPAGAASGLNGGQVIPGLKQDPDELVALFGSEAGERLVDFVGGTAERVFALIEKHSIACDAVRNGWLQPVHSAAALATVKRRVEQWQARGAPVELVDHASTAELLGTERYLASGLDRRAGGLHPLDYARGLARAALGRGAKLFGGSRAVSLARESGGFRIATEGGPEVSATRVLLCTNAYTDDLWPGLRRSVIAASSFQVATAPLPEEISRTILPRGHVASDTRRLLKYFRRDAAGRLLVGGRGPFREPRGREDYAHVRKAAVELFPAVAGVDFEHHWNGRVALTRDHLPHLHEPVPGLTVCLGYNGRGVALATSMGIALAAHIQHGTSLPFPPAPVRPIPFHGLQRLYVAAVIAYYRVRDAW